MNLKQAHYVKTIAQCGSITAAARKLYVSQPSLSQMLRQIEEEIGLPIFDRSVYPFRITFAGEKYLAAAEAILAANAQLESQLREIRQEQSGKLRLGISVSRAMQVLPLVLPVFTKQYPHVELELTESGSDKLDVLVQEGRIDLALAALTSTSPNMTYELIEREVIGILAGKDSRIARRLTDGTPVMIGEACEDPFVSLCRGHGSRVIQDELFRKTGVSPRILIETDSLEIGKRIMLTSGACMILPGSYIDDYVTQKGGAFFPLADLEHNRHFYACYRKDAFVPQYVRSFVQIVIAQLNAKADSALPERP